MIDNKFPWAEFLAIRAILIDYFLAEENKTPEEEVARILSCDPEQVRLIHEGNRVHLMRNGAHRSIMHYRWGRRGEGLCGEEMAFFRTFKADLVTCEKCKMRMADLYEDPAFIMTPIAPALLTKKLFKCLRCDYVWESRKYKVPNIPKICPHCKSKRWRVNK